MKNQLQEQFADQKKAEYWDSIYDRQDFIGECFRQRMYKTLIWLDEMAFSDNMSILDAGCGAGRQAREAAKRGYNVFGLDYSYEMLVKANSILNPDGKQNTILSRGDIESLPYKDSSFDVIICLGVIAYLQSEKKTLLEFERVLKPGGMLILSFINMARIVRLLDLPLTLKKIINKLLKRFLTREKSVAINSTPILKTYLIPSIKKSMEQSGFRISEYETVPYEILTFSGNEVFPEQLAVNVTMFFEKFSNLPLIGSLGGMCILKAIKKSVQENAIKS
ncbi:MAG: hypothetical protein A2Y53_05180 [Chloroflexi bacterium RBG_16_47_49]|nr:MAG: hypothetical protein A2Y53_05180 [Chloroflexi bacterium RBG_16_47_49]